MSWVWCILGLYRASELQGSQHQVHKGACIWWQACFLGRVHIKDEGSTKVISCETTTTKCGCAKFHRNRAEGEPESSKYRSTATHHKCVPLTGLRALVYLKKSLVPFNLQAGWAPSMYLSTPSDHSLWMHAEGPTTDGKKCGIIYKLECADCEKIYVGETTQPF